ncbi:hypothetical protein EVAR_13151_1 [Eumeta japonica]|uniref:Uncharacterized protein n=1 Tax=Eumeta variegata TaxID=151549 RepID=A0A4C1UAJ3_EUMVA|nr:hypothetical protein EVAR_13151_1 [Eumeta japonica]
MIIKKRIKRDIVDAAAARRQLSAGAAADRLENFYDELYNVPKTLELKNNSDLFDVVLEEDIAQVGRALVSSYVELPLRNERP